MRKLSRNVHRTTRAAGPQEGILQTQIHVQVQQLGQAEFQQQQQWVEKYNIAKLLFYIVRLNIEYSVTRAVVQMV